MTGLYAYKIEPFWVELVKKQMAVKHLPDHLAGKTVMQISDLHIGDRCDYHYIIEALQEAQKLNPDFVVYTGDYVSWESDRQLEQLDEVLKSFVKGKIGTIGILGNHDYGRGWSQTDVAEKIVDRLTQCGVDVLRNEQKEYEGLNFIGFDDYWATNFRPEKVMANYDKSKANILLCHNPDVCDLEVWNGYEGWILSGHTHGGQCKIPFLTPPMLPVKNKKYSSGEIDLGDGRTLYVNRALGHLRQIRFNVRPEITLFELQAFAGPHLAEPALKDPLN
ncbi:MAG: metallophosphoesterase [Phycisphaerae bacterium]|nr:metallophosphoesterase [Phycisphaerae bacterium]